MFSCVHGGALAPPTTTPKGTAMHRTATTAPTDLAAAVAFINATVVNHMDSETELYVAMVGRGEWLAGLRDIGAADPHVEVKADTVDAALLKLANAIREESNIGGSFY